MNLCSCKFAVLDGSVSVYTFFNKILTSDENIRGEYRISCCLMWLSRKQESFVSHRDHTKTCGGEVTAMAATGTCDVLRVSTCRYKVRLPRARVSRVIDQKLESGEIRR